MFLSNTLHIFGQHGCRQPTRVPVTYTRGAAVEAARFYFRFSLLHTFTFTFFSAFSQHTSCSFTFLAVISSVKCVWKLLSFMSVFLPVLLRTITITSCEIWCRKLWIFWTCILIIFRLGLRAIFFYCHVPLIGRFPVIIFKLKFSAIFYYHFLILMSVLQFAVSQLRPSLLHFDYLYVRASRHYCYCHVPLIGRFPVIIFKLEFSAIFFITMFACSCRSYNSVDHTLLLSPDWQLHGNVKLQRPKLPRRP